jgi:hypothetical protein
MGDKHAAQMPPFSGFSAAFYCRSSSHRSEPPRKENLADYCGRLSEVYFTGKPV